MISPALLRRACLIPIAAVATLGAQADPLPALAGLRQQTESFLASPGEAPGTGVRLLAARTLRNGSNREYAYPDNGHRLVANPPVFTWPMSDYRYPETFPVRPEARDPGSFHRYGFQLSRSPDFPAAETRTVAGLPLPFFHPHRRLEPGLWYWRQRTEAPGEPPGPWSQSHVATVTTDLAPVESPTADEAYRRLPAAFPRTLAAYSGLSETEWNRAQLAELRETAARSLTRAVPSYATRGEPIPAGASEQEIRQIRKFRTTYETAALCEAADALIKTYALDGRREFLDQALVLARELLDRKPAQVYAEVDFAGAKMMSTLAAVYDLHAWKLPPEERRRYESAIGETVALILGQYLAENIGAADGILAEHFFQHVFLDTFKAVIVLHDRLPRGREWFGLLYDIWLARTPGGGFLDDGAWPNGNQGYLQVNLESMVENYLFFRDFFGVDLFAHPWYRRCGLALVYTVPPGTPGDGFGDGSESTAPPGGLRADFAYVLGRETGNPFAVAYARTAKRLGPGEPYRFESKSFRSYRLKHAPEPIAELPLARLPAAAVLPETGIVSMHTALAAPAENVFLSFRSSPFGVGSHGHADQNAFNLFAGGEALFHATGYRVTTQDRHYLANQKHSRAKNTLTVDGKTQAYGDNGYGWIARFLHGNRITYALGDASRAYQPFPRGSINWTTVCRNAGIYTADQGFILAPADDPQVRLFRRHIALLRPNLAVIYDELEAGKPVTWDWHLNSRANARMSVASDRAQITADGATADATAFLYASADIGTELLAGYYVEPKDWLNPQRGRPARIFDPVQYHSTTSNRRKATAWRYLAIIEIDRTNQLSFSRPEADATGALRIGDYRIAAELDPAKPGRLEIRDLGSGAHLLYGEGRESFPERVHSRSTVLREPAAGFQESADRWPLMIPPQP